MNEETYSAIHSFYQLTNLCKYHELEFCIIPVKDVYIDGWIGACLRNNLLREAEAVNVSEPFSLLDMIKMFPLKESHPSFHELRGSFPKGYNIHIPSAPAMYNEFVIKAYEPFRFSLILHGYFANYYIHFIEAIRNVCRKGIGHPPVPFELVLVSECDRLGNRHTIYEPSSLDQIQSLTYPISLSDFSSCKMEENEKELAFSFPLPINLYNGLRKRHDGVYLDRQHEFPGFSALVRAATNRVEKMMVLYHHPKESEKADQINQLIDSFTRYAVTPILTTAAIQRIDFPATPKEGTNSRIWFSGYIGKLCFNGNFNYYLPLLTFAQKVGVGNHAVYGLGSFEIIKY